MTYLIYDYSYFQFNTTQKQMLNKENLFKEEVEKKIKLKM